MFKLLVNHHKKNSFVNQFRQKRFELLKNGIEKLIQKDHFKILDIGGDIQYWKNIGWQHPACKIHLLNLYESKVPENETHQFSSSVGNGLSLEYKKGEVDLIFSNSVIEHVGSYENQQIFAGEVRRVSDKYIVQTPSIWFPLEPHSLIPLFQFLPHPIRALLIMTFNINYFPKAKTYKEAIKVSHSTLMFTHKRFKQLFPEAEIQVERFLGIPKSYTAIKL
ncbi:MAG: class I SAM-dependent methyltransferase [Sediminibacterium sp.]|nr:class I SAM-dependent methyltransferase [Sediminibacterium sp.]